MHTRRFRLADGCMLASLAVPILLSRISVPDESTHLHQNFWQSANGPYGGYVIRLAVHPNGDVYGGLGGGGVFITTDNGNNWMSANNDLSDKHVRAFAIKANGDVYAGTASGVFRENAGGSWTAVNDNLMNKDVRALAVNEVNEDIFAGTANGVFQLRHNTTQWDTLRPNLPKGKARDVRTLLMKSNGDLFAGTAGGAFRFTGTRWDPVDTNSVKNIRAFVIDQSNQKLFAGTDNGVFYLQANSTVWDSVKAGLTSREARDIRALAIKSNGDVFAATGAGVFHLQNNGTTWEKATDLPDNDVYSLACKNDQYLFAGTLCGVFRSSNNGNTWEEANSGMPGFDISALAINSQGQVFAGTRALTGGCNPFGAAVFRSNNGQGQWQKLNNSLPGAGISTLAVKKSNGSVLAGTSRGLFRSDNNGSTWVPDTTGLTARSVHTIAITTAGDIFAAGSLNGGVFLKTNNNNAWTPLNAGLPGFYERSVAALAVRKLDGNIFAGTLNGIFQLEKNSNAWTNVSANLPDSSTILTLATNSLGYIFAAGSYLDPSQKIIRGIFRSTNDGASWDSVNTGLMNRTVNALAINSRDVIFAATGGGGVFNSTDYGNTWTVYNSGLTSLNVLSLALDEQRDVLYAGTDAGGIFWSQTGNCPLTWQAHLTIADAINNSAILYYGQGPSSTDDIDPDCDEEELPPVPPSGVFDARFELPTTPPKFSRRDYRNDSEDSANWDIRFQPASSPITLSWDASMLPGGSFFLKDKIIGTIVNVDMKKQNNYTLTNPAINSLLIEYKREITAIVPVGPDWNIVSTPALSSDMSVCALFPEANNCQAFKFDNGYVAATTLTPGIGYWIKFPESRNYAISGAMVTSREIPVKAGWNMIGPFESNVLASDIETTPAGSIASSFFAYDNGYNVASTLLPGKGYWVKLSQDARLILPGAGAAKFVPTLSDEDRRSTWAALAIEDAAGRVANLFFTPEREVGNHFELPPVPPAGVLDVRFNSDRSVESMQSGRYEIQINGAKFPIRLRVKNWDWSNSQIREAVNGNLLSGNLGAADELVIAHQVGKLVLETETPTALPMAYRLDQNYPNPFNPTTVIPYALPEPGQVKITLYSALGEKIRDLVNEEMPAGFHQVDLNAHGLASGLYFYIMDSGAFTARRKLIIMK